MSLSHHNEALSTVRRDDVACAHYSNPSPFEWRKRQRLPSPVHSDEMNVSTVVEGDSHKSEMDATPCFVYPVGTPVLWAVTDPKLPTQCFVFSAVVVRNMRRQVEGATATTSCEWFTYIRLIEYERWADRWVPSHELTPRSKEEANDMLCSVGSLDAHGMEEHEDMLLREERIYECLHQSCQTFLNSTWSWKKVYLDRRRECEARWRVATSVRNIDVVYIRDARIPAHYYSPYPAATLYGATELYICDMCLSYGVSAEAYATHLQLCSPRHPLGDEIYRDTSPQGIVLRVFELDGRDRVSRQQCQYLCLLGKLFLDHKTIVAEVEDFVYYVLCEYDSEGTHVVGFFSKECEVNKEKNNLACLVVLPPYQGKGYGRLLVELSYELSKRERRPGTPELPLTPAARATYLSYWRCAVLDDLMKWMQEMTDAASNLAKSGAVNAAGTAMLPTTDPSLVRAQPRPVSAGRGRPSKLQKLAAEERKRLQQQQEDAEGSTLLASATSPECAIPGVRVPSCAGNNVLDRTFSLAAISSRTGIVEHDILITLISLNALDLNRNEVCLTEAMRSQHEKWKSQVKVHLQPSKLRWRW